MKAEALSVIEKVFNVSKDEIKNIEVLKKGMTNRSFLFSIDGSKYIIRIPGEGTEQLINRQNEAQVYSAIAGKHLCDDPVYIDQQNGYKIVRYLDDVRSCDVESYDDLNRCIKKMRDFHNMELKVEHYFDIFGQIDFYMSINAAGCSVYEDYETTRNNVFSLKDFIDKNCERYVLTHIDAVADNFLFYKEDNEEQLQLTDWEYAGMQDPHVDIAMFIIYSYMDKEKADEIIDLYFDDNCSKETRIKIYCYIAACGLLWSNWTEYKNSFGVEFGEYGVTQYKYAKDYYQYAIAEMRKLDCV